MELEEREHSSLCSELGIDDEVRDAAWKEFASVKYKYCLEGGARQWVGCALVNRWHADHRPHAQLDLTRLLLSYDLRLLDFFRKLRQWTGMACISRPALPSRLQRNFSVSAVLYLKLKTLYPLVFRTPQLFQLCWSLFVCVKSEVAAQADDLVTMLHMLLACVDAIFAAAYRSSRDLILMDLKSNSSQPPCIVEALCKHLDCVHVDAKSVKHYAWRSALRSLTERERLREDLLHPDNPPLLERVYTGYVLHNGEFDERVFLKTDNINDDDISKALMLFGNKNVRNSPPETPLTCREYVKNKFEHLTPVSTVTQAITKLHSYLSGWSNCPSQNLLSMFSNCQETLLETVIEQQKYMAVKFLASYSCLTSEMTAASRLHLVEALYYRLLEHVVSEEKRKKGSIDFQNVLGHEVLRQSLFLCSIEIVTYAHGQGNNVAFPWILDCFGVAPFHFYKVIEPVVLAVREKLSRDVIKHLGAIEEKILESLVWTSNSPIWQEVKNLPDRIPQWHDVGIPENREITPKSEHPVLTVRKLWTSSGKIHQGTVQIPKTEVIKKQFFKDIIIRPGQSLLSQNIVVSNGGNRDSGNNNRQNTKSEQKKKQVKTNSLGLFFRKFYNLAAVRMLFLCNNLRLEQEELKQKIWTCFEHTIINQTHLMKDRHLDQILMCTVYVVCKVTSSDALKLERTFTEIMRCYRLQPRAVSNVYRSVLVQKPDDSGAVKEDRVDLIEFYNTVYIKCIQKFVQRFASNPQSDAQQNYTLSPVPTPRTGANNLLQFQRRLSDQHQIYLHPLNESPSSLLDQPYSFQLTYNFNRSPANDLRYINTLMSKDAILKKRPSDGAHEESAKKNLRLNLESGKGAVNSEDAPS